MEKHSLLTKLVFSSLHCHLGEKLSLTKKSIKQCLGGLKCSQNTKENKKTLKLQSGFQCTFC